MIKNYDYTELIESLNASGEFALLGEIAGNHERSDFYFNAANAIQQLIKEREIWEDEKKKLLFALKEYMITSPEACEWCIHNKAEYNSTEYIENCNECNEAQHYCCWTYGGIPHRINKYFEVAEKLKNGFYKGKDGR